MGLDYVTGICGIPRDRDRGGIYYQGDITSHLQVAEEQEEWQEWSERPE